MADECDPLVAATTHLGKVKSLLSSEAERVTTEREKMEEDFPKLKLFTEDCISLNVGGHIFTTTLQTLRKDGNSMLASMFSGRFSMKPRKDGSFFIDRDPTHFRSILNFLRTGNIIIPDDTIAREELLLEAEFYNIKAIIDKLVQLQDPVVRDFPGSTLLNTRDKRLLVSWLEGQNNWHLIYKASRDGFEAVDFHRCCDKKGETISVIHTTEGYLFGGYTDVPWTSANGKSETSLKSFLFAFKSSALGNTPVKIDLQIHRQGVPSPFYSSVACRDFPSVCHHSHYSCSFGGNQISIRGTNRTGYSFWSSGVYSYPAGVTSNDYWLVGRNYFQTQDIEVFGHQ